MAVTYTAPQRKNNKINYTRPHPLTVRDDIWLKCKLRFYKRLTKYYRLELGANRCPCMRQVAKKRFAQYLARRCLTAWFTKTPVRTAQ
jgi:hypothetical protein